MGKAYQMPVDKYRALLKMISEQVPYGIYAIEKKGYAELRHDGVNSMSKLKELTRNFKRQGFKVYSNEG